MTNPTRFLPIVLCLLLVLGFSACLEEAHFVNPDGAKRIAYAPPGSILAEVRAKQAEIEAAKAKDDPDFFIKEFMNQSKMVIRKSVTALDIETTLAKTNLLNRNALAPLEKLSNSIYEGMSKYGQHVGGEIGVFIYVQDGEKYWKITQLFPHNKAVISQVNQIPGKALLDKKEAFLRGFSPVDSWVKKPKYQNTFTETFDDFKYPIHVQVCRILNIPT